VKLESEKFFEKIISKQQLAEFLSLSVSMIDKLMQQGLPYFKIGKSVRFRATDVLIFLERRKRQ
jgi:excisionase family DNA binding protein